MVLSFSSGTTVVQGCSAELYYKQKVAPEALKAVYLGSQLGWGWGGVLAIVASLKAGLEVAISPCMTSSHNL